VCHSRRSLTAGRREAVDAFLQEVSLGGTAFQYSRDKQGTPVLHILRTPLAAIGHDHLSRDNV